MLKLIEIPTYVMSIVNPHLSSESIITIQTKTTVMTFNKNAPDLNFYNLSDFKPTVEPSSYPLYFTNSESVISNYTLPEFSFLNPGTLFLDEVIWGKDGEKIAVINESRDIKEFYNVKDYQFDNDKFALLQQDVLNFYDYTWTKIKSFQGVSNFMYSGNYLYMIRQDSYLSKSIDKYYLDSGIKIVSELMNSNKSYNIIGVDENYVYTKEDEFKARYIGSMKIADDLFDREVIIDGMKNIVITPHREYEGKTYYVIPSWNPDVGVNPY